MKDIPYAANRYLALLSHMFNVAEDWGLRTENTNPCRRIKKYKEVARERFLSQMSYLALGAPFPTRIKSVKAPMSPPRFGYCFLRARGFQKS